ncbi:diaminobutyrate acetyltransferase [Pseudonocardia xinjiangensis]|uniref:L-2,4-diaminobutyric acid acetyltransferase n=1 Tax=Pseudonocardia xinjiangensis TaxID=75289 RepID=A0ABX1RRM0_9PSEU|nr:diaminobutyrate acetyltransferase [Pseudonocardia xinjiangensis]
MAAPATPSAAAVGGPGGVTICRPDVDDGVDCWRLAANTRVLDVNSRYAYLLWFRDFAATSIVAKAGDAVIGFVTGYRRPDELHTLVVWQVAVAEEARGCGLGAAMLDGLFGAVPDADHLEATITPDNSGSIALFTAFADRNRADIRRSELFGPELLGASHEPEILFRIGPVERRNPWDEG